jgi:hypothetical protein
LALGLSALGLLIVAKKHDGDASTIGGFLGILLGAAVLIAACLSAVTQNQPLKVEIKGVKTSHFLERKAALTLKLWAQGQEAVSVDNNGILTAEEVSTMDLGGTWLVSLSACDTGSGQVRAGEGVMGLRRAFVQAGAQNLLMTLWHISDEATAQIMSDFYKAAHQNENASEALAKVRRNWLVKLRKEQGLAKAMSLAGPFIMSSQGKP